jgi:hypothetical protein
MKNKGSVLAITIGLATVFLMFGGAAIYLAGLQGEVQAGQVSSTEAFWLAEAGIQHGFIFSVPGFMSIGDTVEIPSGQNPFGLAEGEYTVTLQHPNAARWLLDSTGTVDNRSKRVTAEVGANAFRAITTTGTLSSPGGSGLDDHVSPAGSYLAGATFDFSGIFNITEAQMKAMAQVYNVKKNETNPDVSDGIIWINGDLKVTNDSWNHNGILIVDGDMNMQGGHFEGLIWVRGNFSIINGNNLVEGSIFVANQDSGDQDTRINGSAALAFDKNSVDNAFIALLNQGGPPSAVHFLSDWQETY